MSRHLSSVSVRITREQGPGTTQLRELASFEQIVEDADSVATIVIRIRANAVLTISECMAVIVDQQVDQTFILRQSGNTSWFDGRDVWPALARIFRKRSERAALLS